MVVGCVEHAWKISSSCNIIDTSYDPRRGGIPRTYIPVIRWYLFERERLSGGPRTRR